MKAIWRCLVLLPFVATSVQALGQETPELPAAVLQAEQRRIEVVEKITPATIAIFGESDASGGGSGVIISDDGFALTNFHVVAPCGPFMLCGMPDGSLVDAVLIGLDPTGDIALIRLLAQREYPYAVIGDSDRAAIGDEVFVAGNPFLLADDFRPTITHGILSGTRRYQYPAGSVLEYADCLQTDASINPGNSGGPIYDADGRLIGINGRASFEKRGRVNVGVGYAVSINQVMRFVDQLKSGRIVDHASLGATVRTTTDRRVLVDAIDRESDAYRRGLRYGDHILSIDGRRVTSANALMNAIATRPAAWRAKLSYRNATGLREAWVRLDQRHIGAELERVVESELVQPKELEENPQRQKLYKHRPGYSNYAVNRQQTELLLKRCPQRAAPDLDRRWEITATDAAGGEVKLVLGDDRCELTSSQGRFWIDRNQPLDEQAVPPGSGGLLVAMHAWRALLAADQDNLSQFTLHGPTPWRGPEQLADKVTTVLGGVDVEYLFDLDSSDLLGIEAWVKPGGDPCRVVFSSNGAGPPSLGDSTPSTVTITHGDKTFAQWALDAAELLDEEPAAE